jgi:two-component system response regulator FlrC
LATTNRHLTAEVSEGRFREDLYFRLNVFPIELPSLRERPDDILPLAYRFIDRYAVSKPLSLSAASEQKLLSHGWRGNIRELGNCIHRACILAPGSEITPNDIVFDALVDTDSSDPAKQIESAPEDLKGSERDMIISALRDSNGSRKLASERLGISGRTLRYKLAKYKEQGIEIPVVSVA